MSEVYSSFHPPYFILSTTCILSNLLLQIIQSMKLKDISAHFYQQNVILCKSCCQQERMPKEKWKNPNSFCSQKYITVCFYFFVHVAQNNGNSKTSPSVDKIKTDLLIHETKCIWLKNTNTMKGNLGAESEEFFQHCVHCIIFVVSVKCHLKY